MKTLKSLKSESKEFYTENAAIYFKKSYSKKMGGTQTITFEDDFLTKIELNDKEYYSGRGAKYNSASMHEHIDVFVSKHEFEYLVSDRAKMLFERQKEQLNTKKMLANFCKEFDLTTNNYLSISTSGYVYFEKSKKSQIEKELKVDLTDFFNASGKTYFFADSRIGLLQFYHNHNQSYSFEFVNEDKRQEFLNERESWVNAPYADLVGQSENINLYVC